MGKTSCPCSLFPTPVGGVRQWRVWDSKHGKSGIFQSWRLFWTDLILQAGDEIQVGEDDRTFRIYMTRPPQQPPPRESATCHSDTGVSWGRKEGGITVTLTLFLNWPLTPVQTHLVQEALGLEGARGQVHGGFSFPTDSSGNLEIHQVLVAFNDLKQTNDAWRWWGQVRLGEVLPGAALRWCWTLWRGKRRRTACCTGWWRWRWPSGDQRHPGWCWPVPQEGSCRFGALPAPTPPLVKQTRRIASSNGAKKRGKFKRKHTADMFVVEPVKPAALLAVRVSGAVSSTAAAC